jgi:hypothetical protein
VNRTQLLVAGFFVFVWLALIAILALAPAIYWETLRQLPGDPGLVEAIFVVALSLLIAILLLGVTRRWRWTFWLVLVAFFAGLLRVPASLLQLTGLLPSTDPVWYEAFQGLIGAVQFGIALAMLRGYRRGGSWAAF